jgi:hypothetical protein
MLATFQKYGTVAVRIVQTALEQVRASGKTIQSVKAIISEDKGVDRFQIVARPYTNRIEQGIGPTTKGPSREMIKSLTEYAQARGMDKPESAAWGLAKKIQKEGDRTFKKGGRIVYSDDVDKLVKEMTNDIKKEVRIKYTRTIKNSFDGA